jgi:UDP-glucose 4-epimerase
MHILVTGGAGYIGSHASLILLEEGHEVTVLDNLSNSSAESLKRVEKITSKKIHFIEGDIRDIKLLGDVFSSYRFDAVIHFAGLKAVGESVAKPILYYENNVVGTLRLLEAMKEASCKTIIFSSSATVYGDPQNLPIKESESLKPTNPYGQTKFMIEEILRDLYTSDPSWSIARLRYFNPAGAHASGLIGEDPRGIPNNLMPYISKVANGTLKTLSVYGKDYPTKDGTGVRDYIHVMDLGLGHIAALNYLSKTKGKLLTLNLGTGLGYSVLDIIRTFEEASQKVIPYVFVDRRPGDIASCFADSSNAKKILGWEAKFNLKDMCQHSWQWQLKNPKGYDLS